MHDMRPVSTGHCFVRTHVLLSTLSILNPFVTDVSVHV